jgi:hypothetical protein
MASGILSRWANARSKAFLSHLAIKGNVVASTQNQAMSALLFLYQIVLDRPLHGRSTL